MDCRRQHRCLSPIKHLLLLALVLVVSPMLAPTRQSLATAQTTGMVVVVWPVPGVQVARGDILAYQVQVKNFGRNPHSNVRVYLPYDARQLTIVDARFDQSQGWISELGGGHVLIGFDEIEGGRSVKGTLYARVAGDLPDGTIINMWPSLSWRNSRTEHPGDAKKGNAAPVIVGATNISSPFVWMDVTPDRGTAATSFRFFSNRFVPDEAVEAVLVTPTGNQRLAERLPVDNEGQMYLEIPGGSLSPGSYQLVVRGILSNLQAVQGFVVE